MEFKKFNSIENTYQSQFVNKIKQHYDKNMVFVAHEKVHGANFILAFDGTNFMVGKRNSWLEQDQLEKFNNCDIIVNKYQNKVKDMYEFLGEPIYIYGELIGGIYPNMKSMGKPLQKDIFYCPFMEYIAYDIFLTIQNKFLNFFETIQILDNFGFYHLKPLITGTLDDILKMDVEKIPTTIPSMLGLDSIEGNFMEGVVIRPLINIGNYHTLLKKKRNMFSEVNKERSKDIYKNIQFEDFTNLSDDFINNLKQYITFNRYINMKTKEGDIKKDILIGLTIQDAIEDAKKNSQIKNKLETITKKERKYLIDQLKTTLVELL